MPAALEAPPVSFASPSVGVRPYGVARLLSRATLASLIAGCAVSLALVIAYPVAATMPAWVSIAIGLVYLASMGLAVGAVGAHALCWLAPLTRGTLAIDARGATLYRAWGSRFVPREKIAAGWALRDGAGVRIELQLRGGDVLSAAVASPYEAVVALDAAGVDPARRALDMQLGGAGVRVAIALASLVPATCVASMIAVAAEVALHLASVVTGFLIFTLVAVSVPLALRLFAPPRVVVGRDGVSVHAGLRPWYLAFDQIERVHLRGREVVLVTRDGRSRSINALGTGASRREALYERIVAGVADANGPRDLSARLTALDRNGRTVEAWREALAALVRSRDDYRSAVLTRDEICAALDDPHAAPERRIGAAFALAAADRADAGARVRVVVDTVAHAPVRVALARAAEGELDDAALTAAADAQARG